jgi:HEAT repeat protein
LRGVAERHKLPPLVRAIFVAIFDFFKNWSHRLGIFDFLKSSNNKSEKLGEKAPPIPKEVARWADKAADKRAQNYDRLEAIAALADLGTVEAVAALLKRFNFVIDPSITDQEEKQIAFDGICAVGNDALEPIREYVKKAESVGWPMKIAKKLLPEDEYIGELLTWLKPWDTEYAKFIDPKVQILAALEELKDPRVREAITDYLYDVNETARFHAVGATLFQDDPASIDKLIEIFCDEESVRIRARICDGFISRGWAVPQAMHADFKKSIPSDFTLDAEGMIRRK